MLEKMSMRLKRNSQDQSSDSSSPTHASSSPTHSSRARALTVNKKAPKVDFPVMECIPIESGLKYWFNWSTRMWETVIVDVRLQRWNFGAGNTNYYHFLSMLLPDDDEEKQCVARRPRYGFQTREMLEADVLTSATCQAISEAFNRRRPIQKVFFLDCCILKLNDGTFWAVENYLPGKHEKVWCNRHGVMETGSRKHPQAFTHFSHAFSNNRLLITGFRGCGKYYRHPTIHTHDGKGFGSHNGGQQAIDEFFRTHWCNSVCNDVHLELHLPNRIEARIGDPLIGDVLPVVERMRLEEYVSDLRPVKGAVLPEELTLLALTEEQYDRLVDIFVSMDLDRSRDLSAEEVQHMFDNAQGMAIDRPKDRPYVEFLLAVQEEFQTHATLTFRAFLICWTKNARPKLTIPPKPDQSQPQSSII